MYLSHDTNSIRLFRLTPLDVEKGRQAKKKSGPALLANDASPILTAKYKQRVPEES